MTDQRTTTRPISVAFVLEDHLGHRTFAQNLRAAERHHDDIDATWIPVTYSRSPRRRIPVPERLAPVLDARRELHGLHSLAPDVRVYNTQVPAVIGPASARRRPYVLVTDVTPRQYDRMADGYGHRADGSGPIGTAKHAWNRHVFRRADHTVAWSTWVRRSLLDEYGVPEDRVSVIPPGVDLERWRPGERTSSDRLRILFVGADFERKGGQALLDVYRSLPAGSAELTIVTKRPVDGGDGITVHNDLAPNDPVLMTLYGESDVFVLPTTSETFGIAAVEAAASGLPVISTSLGGLTDIVIDGHTGFTVAPGDRSALRSRLMELADQPGLVERLGRAARRHAEERFDAAINAGRLFELVRACVPESTTSYR